MRLALGLSVATLSLGLAALVLGTLGGSPSMKWVGGLLLAAAALELTAGLQLRAAPDPRMRIPPLFAGVLTLAFALVVLQLGSPAGAALMVALYLFINGLFCALDLWLDRPRPWLFEALYAAAAVGLGVLLLSRWRSADAGTVLLFLSAELIARALRLAGLARPARAAASARAS